jgi:hypothetical protein
LLASTWELRPCSRASPQQMFPVTSGPSTGLTAPIYGFMQDNNNAHTTEIYISLCNVCQLMSNFLHTNTIIFWLHVARCEPRKLSRYNDWLQAGRSGDRIPVRARFSAPVQTGPGAHPASCTMGTESFPGVKSGRGVTLTPHPLLVPTGFTVCTEPQCLYRGALYLTSVPVQGCTLP